MKLTDGCVWGNNKFFVITEKWYEGWVNDKGILACEVDEQHIEIIKCVKCSLEYKEQDFKGIDY